MKSKRQYLLIDVKKHRRHSAPENLAAWIAPRTSRYSLPETEDWGRASVSDFSVLLENQSESGSSLELDTSNLSRDLSPVPTTAKSSPRDSYQNFDPTQFKETSSSEHWFGTWTIWKKIILSQTIAGCMAIMNAFNLSLKDSRNVVVNGQNFPNYIFLGVFWTTKLALRNDGRDIVHLIKYSGFRYLLLAILHVETNNLLLFSLHHSTYLGNQVVHWIAAALCLMINLVCLEVRFHLVHAFGFGLTTIGALGLFVANATHGDQNQEDVLLGDVLRTVTGICFAFNSIAQEIMMKSMDLVEYLGMIGLLGSIVCGLQALTLENDKNLLSLGQWKNVMSFSAFQLLVCSLFPKILHEMGAPGLHLALAATQFYFYFIQLIIEGGVNMSGCLQIHLLYLFFYGVTMTGSLLFFLRRPVIETEKFLPVKITLIK